MSKFQCITKILFVADRLLELTNKPVQSKVYSLSLNEHCRFLKRLFDDPNFSEIMLPGQSAMTVTLPADTDMTGMLDYMTGMLDYMTGMLDYMLTMICQVC